MARKKNYYDILGVSENASEAEIQAAHRKAAVKWHPDRHPPEKKAEAEKKMQEINEAYSVLSDPKKRENYDRFGSTEDYSQGSPDDVFGRGGGDFFRNIFDEFFRKGSHSSRETYAEDRTRPRTGSDILINLTLSFKESVMGVRKKITLELERACSACKQTGAASRNDIVECSTCQGRGVVNTVQRTILGAIRTQTTCSRCQGERIIIKKKCRECSGKKFVAREETIEINIPRGIQPEKRLQYQGIGNDGWYGGARGDIYVAIKVKENPYFQRKGYDIHVNLPISFLDAILGSTVKVITLETRIENGKVVNLKEVKIKPGSQHGECLPLRGWGCYLGINETARGDFYIWLQVKIPKTITPEAEETLRSIREKTGWNPNNDFIKRNKDIIEN